jgi:hypothetical protein
MRIKESPITIESHNLATGELVGTYAECDEAQTNLRAFNVLGTGGNAIGSCGPDTHSYVAVDRSDPGIGPLLDSSDLESGLFRVR